MFNSYAKTAGVADIGSEIGSELGKKFINDFAAQNCNEPDYFLVGKKILAEVLSQPGCEGLKICNAINEKGERALVYMATDNNGDELQDYLALDVLGTLVKKQAIVADRSWPVTKPSGRPAINTPDTWEWTID